MELDNAPLPPPVKRGRKPAVVTFSTPSGSDDGRVRKAFEAKDEWQTAVDKSFGVPMAETGWTTGVVATRFPPAGQDMLIGGYFNGQYRSMAEYSDERYACIGVEDDLRVEWYERCDNPGAWVWVASVYPNGIELRRTN